MVAFQFSHLVLNEYYTLVHAHEFLQIFSKDKKISAFVL